MLDPKQTVATLVLDHPECAVVLQHHRIDFCCKGHLSLEAACAGKKLEPAAVLAELSQAIAARSGAPGPDPRQLSTEALIKHIVATHHEPLRKVVPFVQTLATKVSRVHGEHNPKLRQLETAVHELADTLAPHLETQEQGLFPSLIAPPADPAPLARELGQMQDEHLALSALLEDVRGASDDFTLPDWACRSYRTLFAELERLDQDLRTHFHLESHVLKPRFLA